MSDNQILTTAIGSLPYTDIEHAIKYALNFDIPFLPQLPNLSATEFMLEQALYPFDLSFNLAELNDEKIWNEEFLEKTVNHSYICWKEFYRQVCQNKKTCVKIQIADPLIVWHYLSKRTEESFLFSCHLISNKLKYMVRQFQLKNVDTIIYLDRPRTEKIIISQNISNIYKQFILELRKTSYKLGLHNCGEFDWSNLNHGLFDIVSFDAINCGQSFYNYSEEVAQFLKEGGILSYGIVSSQNLADSLKKYQLNQLFCFLDKRPEQYYLTPCCGLYYTAGMDPYLFYNYLKKIKRQILAN